MLVAFSLICCPGLPKVAKIVFWNQIYRPGFLHNFVRGASLFCIFAQCCRLNGSWKLAFHFDEKQEYTKHIQQKCYFFWKLINPCRENGQLRKQTGPAVSGLCGTGRFTYTGWSVFKKVAFLIICLCILAFCRCQMQVFIFYFVSTFRRSQIH